MILTRYYYVIKPNLLLSHNINKNIIQNLPILLINYMQILATRTIVIYINFI